MADTQDTETLLAILSSLLESPNHSQENLLNALVAANGDVNVAADLVRSGANAGRKDKKRKRPADLNVWLDRSTPTFSKKRPAFTTITSSKPKSSSSTAGPSLRSRSSSPVKPVNSVANASPPSKPKSSSSISVNAGPSRRSRSSSPVKSVKPVVNLMDVLRPPSSATSSIPRPAPLMLSNASMVADHTPCTLHPSILPPELACELFYTMLHEAQDWKRNQWWLFERLVESPHRTSFYVRTAEGANGLDRACLEVARFWYNGRETDPPKAFPSPMERACAIIERVVNAEMHKRKRFPLEWGGLLPDTNGEQVIWKANFAASNCYEGAKESVGPHSDRLTTLGPYPTIASLSLGTSRVFRLREVIPLDEIDKRAARTYNIPLPHNSLIIMHASTQERFKHSIPTQPALDRFHPAFPPLPTLPSLTSDPSNCRINITFRFYRPDFHPDSIPKCKCGVPMGLRPDMKKHQRGRGNGKDTGEARDYGEFKYWWMCTAHEQNDGKGCGFWKVMDVKMEGRGPFAKDL